jgi:ABC-2 type transport system permease protein
MGTVPPGAHPSDLYAPEYRVENGLGFGSEWSRFATLVKHLTRRYLAMRYRGSVLGFAWSLLNPILLMAVYTFVSRFVFVMNTGGIPYPAFFLTGMLAWNVVSGGAMGAAASLLEGNSLTKKSAFPLVALPVSAVLANGVNYVMTVPILLALNLLLGVVPGSALLLFPVVLALLLLVALAVGLPLAVLIPRFRDLQHVVDVLFVSWFLLTPVLYPMAQITEKLRGAQLVIYTLNPMVGVIEFVHAAFLGQPLPGVSLLISSLGILLMSGIGFWVFSRFGKNVAEI